MRRSQCSLNLCVLIIVCSILSSINMLYTFLFLRRSDGYATHVSADKRFERTIHKIERFACVKSNSKSGDRNKRGWIGSNRFGLLLLHPVSPCLILIPTPHCLSHQFQLRPGWQSRIDPDFPDRKYSLQIVHFCTTSGTPIPK